MIPKERVDLAAAAEPAVEVLSAQKTYPNGTQALLPVDLHVAEGEFVTLLGPSGCGKSTLLKMIAGLLAPTDGRVLLWRKPVAQLKEGGRRLAFVFQAPTLMPCAGVTANVRLPLDLAHVPRSEADGRVAEALKLVGLGRFAQALPRALSGCMQMRVSIARALVTHPNLLLMDEPFGALDEITRDHLNEQLLRLWEQTQKIVIFVTHSIPEAVYLSNRIVVMSPRPGRILEVIESNLPANRTLDVRETPAFLEIAHRVRKALRAGHSYD